MSEGAVVNACLKWLYAHGCVALRNNSGALPTSYKRKNGTIANRVVRFGRKGWSDIIACSPTGRYIEVECKAANNKQQMEQLYHQRDVMVRGGIYILAYSCDDLDRWKGEILA